MLNVMTFRKEMMPCLFISMSSLYSPIGDDPVGHPNTKGLSSVGLKVTIRSATYLAAHLERAA